MSRSACSLSNILDRAAGDDKLAVGAKEEPFVQAFAQGIERAIHGMALPVGGIGAYPLVGGIEKEDFFHR